MALTREVVGDRWTSTPVTIQPGKADQLAGSNSERRAVTIVNDPASVGSVYITPQENNANSATNGTRIAPDRAIELPTAAPVYGYVLKTDGPATVYVIEVSGQAHDDRA